MASVPVQSIQIDFPQITKDLLSFYDEALAEANASVKEGSKVDYSELFYTNRAKIEAHLRLSQDPMSLEHAIETEARFMAHHASGPAPRAYQKFQTYILELQTKLKRILDQGLVNPADEARIKALFQGALKGGELVQPWHRKTELWIGLTVAAALLGMWWWRQDA